MKKFVFENVLLIKPYVFALMGFFLIGPIIIGITMLINDSLTILIGATAVGFAIMFAILKALSKTVEINFDTNYIRFIYDGKAIQYMKSDLKGFYSFNYFKKANSTISMCFVFTDGKKIDISDYLGTGKFIPEKHEMLKNFLTTAEDELGFTDVSVSKSRSFGKIGNVWFSASPAGND
jgi:hypothetical protein